MKPFMKTDLTTYIVFLIASIVIPPLFVINLIVLLVQIIPKIIKEKKEREEFERFQNEILRIELEKKAKKTKTSKEETEEIFISAENKKELLFYLNNLSNSFLGADGERINRFISYCMFNDHVPKKVLESFKTFIINLKETLPEEVKKTDLYFDLEETLKILKLL